MTDVPKLLSREELDFHLQAVAWRGSDSGDAIRAHIAALEAERDTLKAAGALKVNADVIAMILSEAGVRDASYLAVKIANELDPPNLPNYDPMQVARLYLLLGKPDAPTATLSHEAARRVAEFSAAYTRGLEDAINAVDAEPEVPGPMPEELRTYAAEDVARACVSLTKRNIAAAIRALKPGETE